MYIYIYIQRYENEKLFRTEDFKRILGAINLQPCGRVRFGDPLRESSEPVSEYYIPFAYATGFSS